MQFLGLFVMQVADPPIGLPKASFGNCSIESNSFRKDYWTQFTPKSNFSATCQEKPRFGRFSEDTALCLLLKQEPEIVSQTFNWNLLQDGCRGGSLLFEKTIQ